MVALIRLRHAHCSDVRVQHGDSASLLLRVFEMDDPRRCPRLCRRRREQTKDLPCYRVKPESKEPSVGGTRFGPEFSCFRRRRGLIRHRRLSLRTHHIGLYAATAVPDGTCNRLSEAEPRAKRRPPKPVLPPGRGKPAEEKPQEVPGDGGVGSNTRTGRLAACYEQVRRVNNEAEDATDDPS